jgi:hypothetical protein
MLFYNNIVVARFIVAERYLGKRDGKKVRGPI